MPKHFFHCTDGRSLVLDREGEAVRAGSKGLQLAFARFAAHAVRDRSPARGDWSAWRVHVVDEAGLEVAVVPFEGTPEFLEPGERRRFADRFAGRRRAESARDRAPPAVRAA
jgi:hypothetical protein